MTRLLPALAALIGIGIANRDEIAFWIVMQAAKGLR